MAKSEVEELTDKTIARGGILAQLYFDMQSADQSELQPLMTDLINNKLLKSVGVIYCFGAIDEPIKLPKEDVYSTTSQLTILFKDLGALINATFNFAPAGVEILRPNKEYTVKVPELQSLLLDLSNISVNYSHYILSRVLSKEDYEKVNRDMERRKELGKTLLEKKNEKPAPVV
jgi:hypothetical protein